jgi:hypothetical protein
MDIASGGWLERNCDFRREWAKLNALQQRIATMVLDAVRHLIDAHQRSIDPLDTPALILFDRPDRFCTSRMFPRWARLMNMLLPHTQLLITLDQTSRRVFPRILLSETCGLPAPEDRPRKPPSQLPRKAVLLVDLDSRMPNLAQDAERFRFLRSLPGAYVFVQPYRPLPGGKPANLEEFFDERADALIDELIRIIFPQNMKSMENYYRWISRLYAEKFGRPHMPLVDTIFRYNQGERRGHYLAALCDGSDANRRTG